MKNISVAHNFKDCNVLLIGATGFVAKVWLAMTLEYVPNIGRILCFAQIKKRPKCT